MVDKEKILRQPVVCLKYASQGAINLFELELSSGNLFKLGDKFLNKIRRIANMPHVFLCSNRCSLAAIVVSRPNIKFDI